MGFLLEEDVAEDPLEQFRSWVDVTGYVEMALATATADGLPACRMVLLRGVDERGLVFYTNLQSAKSEQLIANPRAALLFRIPPDKQVRVSGSVERTGREEDEAYFATRPRGSQLAAWASPQSRVLASRDALDERLDELEEFFGTDEIACPQDWGGFRVVPETWEFWLQQEHRMHDRIRYRRDAASGSFTIDRLAP